MCQRRWPEDRRHPGLSSVYRSASPGCEEPGRLSAGRRARVSPGLSSRHPAWRSASHPLTNAASEGLSTVLMRISMFVLFMCVTLILLAKSGFAGSRNNLCAAQVALDGVLAGWSFHREQVVWHDV